MLCVKLSYVAMINHEYRNIMFYTTYYFVCNLLFYCSEYSELANELIQQHICSHHLEALIPPVQQNPTDAANHLRLLHQLKYKLLLRNCTPQVWPEYFLLGPLKQYLEWVMEKTENQEFEVLKNWLIKLVSPIDLSILKPKDKKFAYKIQSLYSSNAVYSELELIKVKTEHILELFGIIKNFCFRLLEEFSQDTLDKSIACIKQYITEYKKYMVKTNQRYEKLLLETFLLLLRYDVHLNDFKRTSIKNLQQFNAQPESLIIDYFAEQNTFKLQAFLFEFTVDVGLNSVVDDPSLIRNHISYMVQELSYNLLPLLKQY